MPRKTKASENQNLELNISKSASTSKPRVAKVSAKNVSEKKATSKKKSVQDEKVVSKKETAKKTASTKKETAKKASAVKKETTKKAVATKKETATKKKAVAMKSTSLAKSTSKIAKKATTVKPKKVDIVEYYDLPYRYNQTVVKVLAQTPTNLFIYWDISDEDRENYKKQYGENFFETTKPVLKIYNDTMNYSFEVDINDFANSWYLHVNDSKCDYRVELGRRPISYNTQISTDYIYISTSNEIEAPNDKILFNKMEKMVYFRNVKTNSTRTKSVATLSFIRNMGKIYNIYDLYKEIYKNENMDDFNNPSSRFF